MLTFGFGYIPRMPASACLDLARYGEELGFDTCWLADQTFYYDPFSLLGAIAATTARIEIGLAVTNPFSRHPAQIARAAHALAEVSGGRFTLGLGAGNRKELLDKLGIEQKGTPARTEAAIRLIRALLQGETVDHDGPYFQLKQVALESPLSTTVPLLVGARGPRMLAMAGQVGDGAIVECLLTPPAVAWAQERLRRGRTEVTGTPTGFRYVAWGLGLLVEDFTDVPQDVRNMVGHLIAVMPDHVIELLGLDRDKMRTMKGAYAVGGPAAAGPYVGAQEVSAVTFVGTPDRLEEKLAMLAGAQVDHVSILLMGKTLAQNAATLQDFAKKVLPMRDTL